MSDSGQQKDPFESVRKQIDQIRADADDPAPPTPEPRSNVDVPDLPDLSHLDKLSEKIRNQKVFPQKRTGGSGSSRGQDGDYRGVGIGFAILYAFVGPILAGVGIGWFMDRGNKDGSALVWGALIGTLCGFIGGIVTVVRLTSSGPKE